MALAISARARAGFAKPPCFRQRTSAGRVVSRKPVVRANKKDSSADSSDIGTAGIAAAVAGVIANPIVFWSEYTLKTTGAGLPPGPGGALGAAEGVSYLVIVGIVAWSAYTKATTGTGLPAGPSGLLGAAEGLSYLALVGGIVVFGLNAAGL